MKIIHLDSRKLNKNNLFLGLKIVTATLVVLALFYQDLVVVTNAALQNELFNYILVIPFLFIYLLYRKRKMLRVAIAERQNEQETTRYLPTIIGVLLSATAILTYWHGSYTLTPLQYHMMALPVFTTGLILIFFNTQTLRQSIFAIALLLFLTPPPEPFSSLSSALSATTSKISYSLIKLFQIPANLTNQATPVIQITNISGSSMSLPIDSAFSGIYSLIGFIAFGMFTAYIMRDKLWKKLVLFAIGLLLVYIINIAKITAVLTIGYQIGEQAALTLSHQLGGLVIILTGTLICLIIAEKIMHAHIFSKSTQNCSNCNPQPEKSQEFCLSCGRILKPPDVSFRKSEIAKIVAMVGIAILLVSIQTPVFALTTGPAQIVIQTPTGDKGDTQLLPQISNYELQFLYRDTDFENTSGQEAALMYVYKPLDETRDPIYVGVEIASTTTQLRLWEYSSVGPGGSAYAKELEQTDIQILDNPPIIAKYYAFNLTKTNQTQVILYWSESAVFMTNNTAQQKQVGISLVTFPHTLQNLTWREELLPFATTIAQYWEPIKAWTQIGLLLSQQSLIPAAATGIAIPAITVLYILRKRNERKANARVYPKLSEQTKNVIDIISETEKTKTPTLNAINATYKTRIGESTEEEMLQKLREAEKTGIVKSEIANVRDEPTQIWKT